jgi:hypothetical protein
MNTVVSLLVPLVAMNPCSSARTHGYVLSHKNPLQTKVRHNYHADSQIAQIKGGAS